mmetsp:Transcript_28279/g.43985  ORF Transcript_28279/g.43985 Transcript_28279/m.43985 type:complete len:140 (-) Transcript_28279:203-622(-)|eukprot:CAMPEP_0196811000 /NCGR_PEP_ID=MMETSP1362-20130617/16231_1 /TAXON_ID=163516 /ORGANISM="Leptocylindrus danicus, Strain CCMP1856" /LENGTH=139 /DNA_ID=CAMNT_0042186223 /DNA_START=75 /DNA_END=494 /DNA_ORIENTATION=+
MAQLTIVAPLTTIGSGKVELGSHELEKLTIGEVKAMISNRFSDIPTHMQKLWWRGYILDEDDAVLTRACVGVNKGETISTETTHSLTLFMTMPELKINEFDRMERRKGSLDLETLAAELAEIRDKSKQQIKKIQNCVVM